MSGQSNSEDDKRQAMAPEADTPPSASAPADQAPDSTNPATDQSADRPGPKAYVDPTIMSEVRIAEVEAERDEIRDKYLRVAADNQNLIKRSEREKIDTAKYAITNFAREVLSVGDNLQRAIEAVASAGEEQTGALKALIEGVELTQQELSNTLERHGVRPIAAAGELFDPHVHQAVMEQENKDVPAGTVLQVFQDGYQIDARVLRPAMVVVAKGGMKPVKTPGEATTAEAPKPAGDEANPNEPNSAEPDVGG